MTVYSRCRQSADSNVAASTRPSTPRWWCAARRLQRRVRQPVRARLPTVPRLGERMPRPARQAAGDTPAVDDARLPATRPGVPMQCVGRACPAVPAPDSEHGHHLRRREPPRTASTAGSPATDSGCDGIITLLEHDVELDVIASARVLGRNLRHGARRGGLDVIGALRECARAPTRSRHRATSSARPCAGGPRPQTY